MKLPPLLGDHSSSIGLLRVSRPYGVSSQYYLRACVSLAKLAQPEKLYMKRQLMFRVKDRF